MNRPADAPARQRFAHELKRNFSVVASAGSGKTRAITDRIVALAQSPEALERLPQLVVVTYTNRAADEMQQRTRQRILEVGLSQEVLEAFGRAFFGTIHSFCVKLLSAYGHHLGLPAELELITDDQELWDQFVQQHTSIGSSLGKENRRVLLRHVQARQLMELARQCEVDLDALKPDGPCPKADFSQVLGFVARGNATRVPKDQAALRQWIERWQKGDGFAPWPRLNASAGDFPERWRSAFRPLRDWVNACALCVAAEVQQAYRDFRFQRGVVTYADQVALAAELIRLPNVVRRIREKNYRVILDEAQDTDPQQFLVLLEITRPIEATGIWRATRQAPPRPGHFCMVGDFQQSIYREPSDLERYRQLHEGLIADGAAEELKFTVTFRLDRAQLDFVNAIFPSILDNREGQVAFVELNERPETSPGQVIRLPLASEVDLALPESHRAAIEAREIAEWLQAAGLEKLRAESWRQVAILSPRKAWLRPLRDALLKIGLPAEVQSESDLNAENPAYAWLTALLAIMVEPNAHYEIVGVLREVFGLSDDELARFSDGDGARFQIAQRSSGRGVVPEALNLLMRLRLKIQQQPLFSAVREIVRLTQLRERLHSLPPDDFADLSSDLDKLLSEAATAEARGQSLADFARSLCERFHSIRETNPPSTNAIQLITAHKAKGSEWQTVIVPFLTRKVHGANPRYPTLLQVGAAEQPQIAFDKTDADEFKESLEMAEREEMERLLYVALTRAKHTLVLVDDTPFFPKANGSFHSHSEWRWLKADANQPNESSFTKLSPAAAACPETALHETAAPKVRISENLGPRDVGWLDRARQNAAGFVQTVLPSKLATEEAKPETAEDEWLEVEPELRPPRIDNPATRYGVWWHRFMQQIPWLRDAAAWDEIFTAQHVSSPDVARAAREWRLLREQVRTYSDFAPDWEKQAPVIRAEMPFFWKMRAARSLEGIIDLAFFDPRRKEWLIVDWKTNRVGRDKVDTLRAKYRPQLAAYCQVIKETTGHTVRAAIYSTATGEFVRYQPAELAAEWERLKQVSAETLFAELGDVT